MATEADRLPAADGLKMTETVQLAPAATLTPQVLVWLKSAALVPVIATLVMDKAALPEFETVIVWTALAVLTSWLAKLRLEAESVIWGATPAPVKLTLWGEPVALSLMVIDA